MKTSLFACLILGLSITSSFAQVSPNGTQGSVQGATTAQPRQGARNSVATQPSNNPFRNPIGQGVPPAASANPGNNSNRTSPN